jgi:hypothetical protein
MKALAKIHQSACDLLDGLAGYGEPTLSDEDSPEDA